MLKNAVLYFEKGTFWVIFVTAITQARIKLETSLDKIWNRHHELYNSTASSFLKFEKCGRGSFANNY